MMNFVNEEDYLKIENEINEIEPNNFKCQIKSKWTFISDSIENLTTVTKSLQSEINGLKLSKVLNLHDKVLH